MRGRDAQRGFTLLELLVVLGILAFIAGVATPLVLNYFDRAKVDTARIQVEYLAQALDLYRLDNGGYPSQEQGLAALIEAPAGAERWQGPYIKGETIPADPWGRPYGYKVPGSNGRAYDLVSLGADGAQGGSDENADIRPK